MTSATRVPWPRRCRQATFGPWAATPWSPSAPRPARRAADAGARRRLHARRRHHSCERPGLAWIEPGTRLVQVAGRRDTRGPAARDGEGPVGVAGPPRVPLQRPRALAVSTAGARVTLIAGSVCVASAP